VHLQAHSLGLGAVMVGAFSDKEVKGIIGRKDEMPLYMIPVGKPALRGKQ
ncbi:MAG: nitroreductase family protein, partial [Candidatus Omnitrophica bacterium]|nr:nitroreductase family protein [Candidatus Omnitrophota bacterium]